MGGGYHVQQAWASDNSGPLWRTVLEVAFTIATTSEPTAIMAETVACHEATMAILSTVLHGVIPLSPRCRVRRQGALAEDRFTL